MENVDYITRALNRSGLETVSESPQHCKLLKLIALNRCAARLLRLGWLQCGVNRLLKRFALRFFGIVLDDFVNV